MDVGFDSFPADDKRDPKAYLTALDSLKPGDFVFIFTPDDLHFEMIKVSPFFIQFSPISNLLQEDFT